MFFGSRIKIITYFGLPERQVGRILRACSLWRGVPNGCGGRFMAVLRNREEPESHEKQQFPAGFLPESEINTYL